MSTILIYNLQESNLLWIFWLVVNISFTVRTVQILISENYLSEIFKGTNWELVELKMLDFSDHKRTGNSILTSAAVSSAYHNKAISSLFSQNKTACFTSSTVAGDLVMGAAWTETVATRCHYACRRQKNNTWISYYKLALHGFPSPQLAWLYDRPQVKLMTNMICYLSLSPKKFRIWASKVWGSEG